MGGLKTTHYPTLFYVDKVMPLGDQHQIARRYLDRLMKRAASWTPRRGKHAAAMLRFANDSHFRSRAGRVSLARQPCASRLRHPQALYRRSTPHIGRAAPG
jgi:hypothetical protein